MVTPSWLSCAGGRDRSVTIASGAQSGLKINLAFTVVDGSTVVNLLFDEGATFQNVTATAAEP